MYMYIYIYIYMYTHIYIYIYVYISCSGSARSVGAAREMGSAAMSEKHGGSGRTSSRRYACTVTFNNFGNCSVVAQSFSNLSMYLFVISVTRRCISS